MNVAAAPSDDLDALRAQALVQARSGELAQAIETADGLLRAAQERMGPQSLEVALATGLLARLEKGARHPGRAETLYRHEIEILDKLPGQGGHEYLIALSNLGNLVRDAGRLEEAEPLLRRALELGIRSFGNNPDLAFHYNDLGLLAIRQRRFDEAEAMLKRALDIRSAAAGIDRKLLAISYDNLGNLYLSLKRFAEAQKHLLAALDLFRTVLGPADPDTLICVMNVADLYAATDRREEAIALLSTSLDTLPRPDGASYRFELLLRRGEHYLALRQFSAAQADLGHAVEIAGGGGRAYQARLVKALLAQARLFRAIESYEVGDAVLARAQSLEEAAPQPNARTLAAIWSDRGWFQSRLRNWGDAQGFLKRSLEHARLEDPGGLRVAVALNNLAGVQTSSGKISEAQASIAEAIAILETRGPQGVDLAESHNILGSLLERLGDLSRAEQAYRRALALFVRLLAADDPRVVNVQTNLGLLLMHTGRTEEALQVARLRASAFESQLLGVLRHGDEQQALAFVRAQNPFALFGTLGLAEPVALAIFNYQGTVTDAVVETRVGDGSPQRREALARWWEARRELTQWTLEESTRGAVGVDTSSAPDVTGTPDTGRRQATRDKLGSNLAAAQAEFARLNGGRRPAAVRFDVRVEDVRERIPADAALLDYVRYSAYLGGARWEDRYGVLVVTRNTAPKWVPLQSAKDIEDLTDVYRRAVRGNDPVNSLTAVLRTLQDVLVEPAIAQLPVRTRRLLIVPDGELNFVSFASLLDARKRFLAEHYGVTYLANARALLENGTAAVPQRRSVRIYANPAFRTTPSPAVAPKLGLTTASFRLPELAPLPFTQQEARALLKIAGDKGWQATLVDGAQATESDLRSASAPGILHLATHGFWLPRFGTELVLDDSGSRGIGGVRDRITSASARPPAGMAQSPLRPPAKISMEDAWRQGWITSVQVLTPGDVELPDPMLRSAVALSGAQETLEGWRAGRVRPTGEDGILTAQEAGMLELHGTWLVTLSSCDSGSGESEPGEGIMGLRRGFLQAGASNVLTTLWPVSDVLTPRLMDAFYAQAFATLDAPVALAKVQRRFLLELRKKYGVAAAVRLVGAFVLTTQGAGLH